MRSYYFTALPLTCLVLLSSCANYEVKDVRAKYWKTPSTPSPKVTYPEKALVEEKRKDDKGLFGIAFSGGGTRSATATLGQLRALHKLEWIDEVDYISAVSGGAWTAVPYTFLNDETSHIKIIKDKDFLGCYRNPSNLNAQTFMKIKNGEMADAIAHTSTLSGRLILEWIRFRKDESYSRAIGSFFLKPFGLNTRKKFFTWDKNTLDDIKRLNPKLFSDDQFFLTRKGRPYLIVGGTLLSVRIDTKKDDLYPLEMTPWYTGLPLPYSVAYDPCEKYGKNAIKGERQLNEISSNKFLKKAYKDECRLNEISSNKLLMQNIGGGFVESFVYDAYKPRPNENDNTATFNLPKLHYRFTLSDVVGVTGAAPQEMLSRFKLEDLGFPELNHWAIAGQETSESEKPANCKGGTWPSCEYAHGDGGHVDNTGITALLAREVPRILVFLNAEKPFRPLFRQEIYTDEPPIYDDVMSDSLIGLFRVSDGHPFLRVFENKKDHLRDIVSKWSQQKKNGEPLVFCDELKTITNDRYGIRQYKPRVCFVYLDASGGWDEEFKKSTVNKTPSGILIYEEVIKREGRFKNFPNYRTFFNKKNIIDLTRAQTHALASLTAWNLVQASDDIGEYLSLKTLAGKDTNMYCEIDEIDQKHSTESAPAY